MSRFRAAIFDLDGVLADTARAHYTAWKRIADGLGVPFDEAANEALKGIDRMGSLDRILAAGGLSLTDADKQRIAAHKNALYLEALAAVAPQEMLLPGATRLVEQMRAAGLACAVASSSRNAPLILERTGLAPLLDHVADPARARPKPAPDIFLDCAARLGCAPSECVAFEDAVAGVQAIVDAGMRAIGIGEASVLAGADQIYPTTAMVDVARVLAG